MSPAAVVKRNARIADVELGEYHFNPFAVIVAAEIVIFKPSADTVQSLVVNGDVPGTGSEVEVSMNSILVIPFMSSVGAVMLILPSPVDRS